MTSAKEGKPREETRRSQETSEAHDIKPYGRYKYNSNQPRRAADQPMLDGQVISGTGQCDIIFHTPP